MAFIHIKNVKIAGISAGVPSRIVNNLNAENRISENYDNKDFVETTGVIERRISNDLTTSDLCYAAAEQLIKDLGWEKSEIEAIIMVSQTLDYILPATGCIMQERLGLSKECYAEDIQLGCSGWVYGLSSLAALMQQGYIKKALLMVGDAKKHIVMENPDPLFGYAGTVTALEFELGNDGFKFHFGTDGSGYDAIIIPDGGSRNPITPHSFEEEIIEGRKYNRLTSRMKGMDVFSFGISTAPKSIKKLAQKFEFDYLDYNYFIFHQANKKMNELIVKKLKLDADKVPMCMSHFGNTSSASIPLTIVTQLGQTLEKGKYKFICCGFGVGLSWGTVAFTTDNIKISKLVEVDSQYE